MTDYTKLTEALRRCASVERCDGWCEMNYGSTDCESRLEMDAADAIEKLVTLYEKAEIDATNLTGKLTQAEAQIDKLRQRIDELEEKQTYCDAYGDKWMTSGKDVPTEAYKHGYMDGMDEAKAQLPKRGKWIDDEFGAKCSFCGKYAYRVFEIPWKSPYCPLCGAKMDGEVEHG